MMSGSLALRRRFNDVARTAFPSPTHAAPMLTRRGAVILALAATLAAAAGCLGPDEEPVSPQATPTDTPEADPGPSPIEARDVELAIAEEETLVWPGRHTSFHAELHVPADAQDNATLRLEAPSSWTTSLSPRSLAFSSPTTVEIRLTVAADADRQPPPVLLHAHGEDGQRLATAELPLSFVQPRFEIPEAEREATPGSQIPIDGHLAAVPDELAPAIELATPDGWQANLETDREGANRSLALRAQVTIPESAEPGREHELTLLATTESGPPLAEHGVEVTVAEAYRAGYGSPPSSRNLTILVVPPAHGPVANTERGALPQGADGASPAGAYLDATLHALADWRWALDRVAENRTELAWLSTITWETHVVAEDDLAPEHVQGANIVMAYGESTFPAMGAAPSQSADERAPDCLAYASMASPTYGSLTYEGMHQLALHELMHCFGQDHVENGEPAQDAMVPARNGPMTELRCPSNLNVLATAAAYQEGHPADVFALEIVQGRESVELARSAYRQHCSPHEQTPEPEPVEP